MLTVVAAALIDGDGRVLVQQRPLGGSMAGLWEFPGGKVEPGETLAAALVRELHEELGIDVETTDLAPFSFVNAALGTRQLLLLLYLCHDWKGDPVAQQATALQWLSPSGLRALAMPPADRPLVAALEKWASRGA